MFCTYAGYENRVKSNLESRIETMGMTDYIFRVLVPEQEVEVEKMARPRLLKKMTSGYALVEMIMTDEAWYVVRNTRCYWILRFTRWWFKASAFATRRS